MPLPADPNAPRQRFPTRHEGGLIPGASEVLVRALAGEGVLSHRGLRTIGGPSALNAANAGNPLPALAGSLAHAGASGGSTVLPATLAGASAFGAAAPPSVNLHMTIQAWDRADLNDAFRDEIIPRLRDALQFNQQGILTTMKSSLGR